MEHKKINVNINSEIGELECVITHTPGSEIESMSPENASRELYNDMLNLGIARPEHNQFSSVLKKLTNVFEVSKLLEDILAQEDVKMDLLRKINETESIDEIVYSMLLGMDNQNLAMHLIEGVETDRNTLTGYLTSKRYMLQPLPNLFFTRDPSFALNNKVVIGSMASKVRRRESLIMKAIFESHPIFGGQAVDPVQQFNGGKNAYIEGGDVLVAAENIFLSGISARTNSKGIDALISYLKTKPGVKHLILQELPDEPKSFIHLDMVFTLLDKDKCMVYEPVVLSANSYRTYHLIIEGEKAVKIHEEDNIPEALRKLGMDLEPIYCGGDTDIYAMEREQWQSGANFFALGPGKVIGYARNVNSVEALSKHGYEIIKAEDMLADRVRVTDYDKYVITVRGDELNRGGGGARCMTMPIRRKDV